MRVLMIGHRKMDVMLLDASTRAHEDAAYLLAFKLFDDDDFYSNLDIGVMTDDELREMETAAGRLYRVPLKLKMRELYRLAQAGSAQAARDLLILRKNGGYEYEDDWRLVDVESTLPSKAKRKRKHPKLGLQSARTVRGSVRRRR